MSDLKEFAINLPMTSVAPTATSAVPVDVNYDITANTTVPSDVAANECKHISVSVDSASVTNYDPHQPMVQVDLVLNVSINNQNSEYGSVSSYKIVKRLSMDRVKLALQAEHMEPYQVVEDQDDPAEVEKMMAEFYAAKRARELVGLAESRGDKSFKVLFSFDDESAAQKATGRPARATATKTIDAVKDAAHARHAFNSKYAHKYKNLKITRATEVADIQEAAEADKKFPNTRDGVKDMLTLYAQKSVVKHLDLDGANTTIYRDPAVGGVWIVDNAKTRERVIVYLAGYKDQYGNNREMNDFEIGKF